MPVSTLLAHMSSLELSEWVEWMKIKNKEEEDRQKEQERKYGKR